MTANPMEVAPRRSQITMPCSKPLPKLGENAIITHVANREVVSELIGCKQPLFPAK